MAATDRGNGPLTSLSAHVTAGAAEWTGNVAHDFAFEEDIKAAEEEEQDPGNQPISTPPEQRPKSSGYVTSHCPADTSHLGYFIIDPCIRFLLLCAHGCFCGGHKCCSV